MYTLTESLKAIENRKDFIVTRWCGVVSINYLIRLPDSFDGMRSNFRGITFDEHSGQLLSLPFHKFYNINETPETQWDILKDLEATIYEKVDGTLIHWFNAPDFQGEPRGLTCGTRMRLGTPQALAAFQLVKDLKLWKALHDSVDEGFTPLFEYVSPSNPIVLVYNKPQLIYLISRNRTTGEYVREPRFLEFDHVKEYKFKFLDLMKELEDKKDFEGYVCHLSNGMIVKAKCDWYLERHRVVDLLMKPTWKVWEAVYNDLIDDVVSKAADMYKPKLKSIWNEAQQRLFIEIEKTKELFNYAWIQSNHIDDPRKRRKRFVEVVNPRNPLFFAAIQTYDSRDIVPSLKKYILDDVSVTKKERFCENLEE